MSRKQEHLYASAVTEFGPSLTRLAAAYEANRTNQEDLLQEIHLAVWRSFATFANQCSLRTWVYRVAHNAAASHVRVQRQTRRSQSLALVDPNGLTREFGDEKRVDDAELLAKVRELVHRLRPIDRDVLLLYLEGMEAAEIAEVVGISASNVAQKVHRAKRVLKQTYSLGD